MSFARRVSKVQNDKSYIGRSGSCCIPAAGQAFHGETLILLFTFIMRIEHIAESRSSESQTRNPVIQQGKQSRYALPY